MKKIFFCITAFQVLSVFFAFDSKLAQTDNINTFPNFSQLAAQVERDSHANISLISNRECQVTNKNYQSSLESMISLLLKMGLYNQALKLSEKFQGEDTASKGRLLARVAVSIGKVGKYKQSLSLLKLIDNQDARNTKIKTLFELAQVFLKAGKVDEAHQLVIQANTIQKQVVTIPVSFLDLNVIAQVFSAELAADKISQANDLLSHSIQTLDELKADNLEEAKLLSILAVEYVKSERKEQSVKLFKKVLKLVEYNRTTSSPGSRPIESFLQELTAVAQAGLGQHEDAARSINKINFLRNRITALLQIAFLANASGNEEETSELLAQAFQQSGERLDSLVEDRMIPKLDIDINAQLMLMDNVIATYIQMGLKQEIISKTEGLKNDFTRAWILSRIAIKLFEEEKMDIASEVFDRSFQLFELQPTPGLVGAYTWIEIAKTGLAVRKNNKAIEALNQASQLSNSDVPELKSEISLIIAIADTYALLDQEKMKNFLSSAVQESRKVKDPDRKNSLFAQAINRYVAIGNYTEALKLAKEIQGEGKRSKLITNIQCLKKELENH